MKIRLFIFDWDGTALGGHDPYDRFPLEFARFLDGLAKRGIGWATNTTWSVADQAKVIRASGVTSIPVFLAGSSGRIAAHMTNRGVLQDRSYARWINSLDRMFEEKFGKAMRRIAAQLLVKGLADQLEFNPCNHHYMTVHFPGREEARAGWRLINPFLKRSGMYRVSGKDMNGVTTHTIMPAFMNKGTIIAYMQKRMGIRPEETLVAGDGRNDRHMFSPELTRGMICPANAHPTIKALVRKHSGIVSKLRYSWGIIDAAEKLMVSVHSSRLKKYKNEQYWNK